MVKKVVMATVVLFYAAFVQAEVTMVVFNYQAALFNSAAAQQATNELREQAAPAQQQLQDIQQGIQTRQSRLQTDADILTEAELQQFQEELQVLVAQQNELNQRLQAFQQQARNAFEQRYRPVILEIVEGIVEEQDIDVVLEASAVAYNRSLTDITETVLEAFDAQYAETSAESTEQ